MSVVNTVLGEHDTAGLGRTLMHEHVFTLYGDLRLQAPWNEDEMVARAVAALRELKATGFDTIVDLTVWGLGRSVPRIARISAESGITIIPSTGIYTFSDIPSYFRSRTLHVDEDFISDFLIGEIENGIEGTGIRAGMLKVATDHQGVTADVDLLIRQTARAHLATGVPITTHSHSASEQGLAQQRILKECGVDLARVIIGHAGDATDADYLERLAGNGSWLGMDRFGHEPSGALETKIEMVAEMCRRGYASRMVLSHDTNVASDNTPDVLRSTPAFRDWRYTCIAEIVLPALRDRGVSDADIDAMTLTNPALVFA